MTLTSQGATAANVSLLTCQSNRFIDKSSFNQSFSSPNGHTGEVLSGSPFLPLEKTKNAGSTVFNGATPTFNISSNKNSKIAPRAKKRK